MNKRTGANSVRFCTMTQPRPLLTFHLRSGFKCGKLITVFHQSDVIKLTLKPNTLAIALYAVIFDEVPSTRASELAQELLKTQESTMIDSIISDIDFEIATPAQCVKDIHDCRASEQELRNYLARLSTELKALRHV